MKTQHRAVRQAAALLSDAALQRWADEERAARPELSEALEVELFGRTSSAALYWDLLEAQHVDADRARLLDLELSERIGRELLGVES